MNSPPRRRRSDRRGLSLRDRCGYRCGRIRSGLKEWFEVLVLLIATVAVGCAVVATIVAIGVSGDATRSANESAAAADRAAAAAARAAATLRAQKRSDDRAVERDAARSYQRCEQIEPLAVVVQLALDISPGLRTELQRDHADLLGDDGRLPVPDCEQIYPRGASVSDRYPDLTPTKPAP